MCKIIKYRELCKLDLLGLQVIAWYRGTAANQQKFTQFCV